MAELNPIANGDLVPVEQNLKRTVFLAGIAKASTIKKISTLPAVLTACGLTLGSSPNRLLVWWLPFRSSSFMSNFATPQVSPKREFPPTTSGRSGLNSPTRRKPPARLPARSEPMDRRESNRQKSRLRARKPLEEQDRALTAELPKLQAEVDAIEMRQISAEEVFAEATGLHRKWPHFGQEEKRRIIESIVEKITLSGDTIDITWSYLPSSEELTKRQRNLSDSSRQSA